MANSRTIYQKRSDNSGLSVFGLGTWAVDTGTPNTAYPAANVADEIPARVSKIDSTTGSWRFGNASTKVPLEIVGLIHHDFDAGLDVRIEASATNDFAVLGFAAAFTIPAWRGVGTTRWPVNPWLDLTTVTPITGSFDATGFKWWRIRVAGTNSQQLQIGQIWLGKTIRRFTPNIDWGLTQTRDKPVIESRTAWKVPTLYTRGTTLWTQSGSLVATDNGRDALRDQWDDVDGRSYPFLLVPDGLTNECYLVRWLTTQQKMTLNFKSNTAFALDFEEVPRGLRPGV